jgi:hypothetical protein
VDGDHVRSRGGDLALTAEERPAVDALLAAGYASASDLGLALTRRLLLGGVVTLEPGRLADATTEEQSHP